MLYIESKSKEPDFNLALEQYVFDHLPCSESYIMLWQNDKAVIVGKNQNTPAEVNLQYAKEHGIRVVRRLSGGGAVYHDLGNINFTFIVDAVDKEKIDMQMFCLPVVRTLSSFGVTAEISGRNDILIDGRKFSGNAQYIKKGRVMHHGTIMFDSDLEKAASVLNVDEEKIRSKGVKSTKSRMTSVKPHIADKSVDLRTFWDALKQNIAPVQGMTDYELTAEDLELVEEIRLDRYATCAWNFGDSNTDSPIIKYCEEQFLKKKRRIESVGGVELDMTVADGAITALSIHGDFFGSGDVSELKKKLIGVKYEKDAIKSVLEGIDIGYYFHNLTLDELIGVFME